MKQEIKKVGDELSAGFTRAGQLKQEVEKITADLEKELSSSTSSQSQSKPWQPRIPLQSFLFGIKFKNRRKTKKSWQKQLSYIIKFKNLQDRLLPLTATSHHNSFGLILSSLVLHVSSVQVTDVSKIYHIIV